MLRKILTVAALVVAVGCLQAQAGFDMYEAKKFTTCLAPTLVADNTAAITNSTVTGVEVAGLIGNGALVFSYQCNGGGANAVLSFSVASSSTTNGTYYTYTNASGTSAWAFTNAAGYAVMKFRPNGVNRYLRVVVTPSGSVTNAAAGALLITE